MSEKKLSARQQQILSVVEETIAKTGYPPSVREIGQLVGLASPSTVKHHLDALERKGLLSRSPGIPRALDLRKDSCKEASPTPPTSKVVEVPVALAEGDTAIAPLVGRIAAGAPITAEQAVEDLLSLPTRFTGKGNLFALEVHGDSMIDGAICDGDVVIVRAQTTAEEGQIVAALLEGEATVKVLSRRDGHQWLLPMNENYSPILGDDASILGIVVALIRSL